MPDSPIAAPANTAAGVGAHFLAHTSLGARDCPGQRHTSKCMNEHLSESVESVAIMHCISA